MIKQKINLSLNTQTTYFKTKKGNIKAFTLMELVIVITILAILGTIAFISLEDYSKSSRNSVRLTDIGLIKQSLGIFEVETGYYPLPEDYDEITYNKGVLWYQGTFDDKAKNNLGNLSKKPVDPLFELEYDYSVINNKAKYQLGTVMEGGLFSKNNLTNTSYAASYGDIESYVTGDYDHFALKSQSGSNCVLLPIPSLFINNSSSTGSISTGQNHYFVFDTSDNISSNYSIKINSTKTPEPFILQEVYNKCSIDTEDDLNIFISRLSVTYQQLILTNYFNEIIYNFSEPTFKVGMIDNLVTNGVTVNSDLKRAVMNPSATNIFNDTFTSNDNTNLVGSHTPDSLGNWVHTGSLLDNSYIINSNSLQKNDSNDGVVYPEPIFPINSRDRTILFNILDFAGGDIELYASYYDVNNYFKITFNSTGYIFDKVVGGVHQDTYPIPVGFSYGTSPLVEFKVSGTEFELIIDGISQGISVDGTADFNGLPAIKIGSIGGKIDNFNMLYK